MVTEFELQGLRLIDLKVYRDDRGFFTERYQRDVFSRAGIPVEFVQDNHSRSIPGVIRGLHYQHHPGQGKLVGVVRGKILDVAVDLRRGSPTFGKWVSVELSDEKGQMLWIPPGFAHGFCALGVEPADVIYKVDAPYSPSSEGGIRFDDPDLNIVWPVSQPVLSEKDKKLQTFAEYSKNPVFFF